MSSQLLLKSIAAGWAFAAALSAAELPPERVADDVLTLRVQAAIADDPTLKLHHLNLLVTLFDGMAVIGGEVPDMALLPAVERVARNVPGVRAVKVSGWVPADRAAADPFRQRLADQLGGTAKPVPAAKGVDLGPPPMAIPAKPVETRHPDASAVSRKPLAPAGLLMEPVVAGARIAPAAPGAATLPYPTIPPPGVPTQPVLMPAGTAPWDELRRSDVRYLRLDVLRTGRGFTVTGTAAKLADAWEFAEKLQALPQVDEVVVGRIEVR